MIENHIDKGGSAVPSWALRNNLRSLLICRMTPKPRGDRMTEAWKRSERDVDGFAVFEVILRIRRLHGEVISRGSWWLWTPSLMKHTFVCVLILRVLQYINIYILKSSLIRFLLFLTGNCLKLEFSFFKLTESLN